MHSIKIELGKIVLMAFMKAILRSSTKTELAMLILHLVTKFSDSFMAHLYDSSTSLHKNDNKKLKV